jgi:MFS family permease
MHLDEFYPGAEPPRPRTGMELPTSFQTFLRDPRKLTAFITTFAVQGNMSMMMAMTAYTLDHHGHALPLISTAVALHVMGMFGLSIPLGRLADRIGRKPVMMGGVVVAGVGSLMIVATDAYWIITLGTVLVGIGWSAATVAATALIADTSSPAERGRAIGANDTFAAASGIVLPLLGGPIAEVFGLVTVGVVGAALTAIPLGFHLRLNEPQRSRS